MQIAEITDGMKRQAECMKINLTFCCCVISERAMSELSERHSNWDDQINVENELTVFLIEQCSLITELRYVGTVKATIGVVDEVCYLQKCFKLFLKSR